MRYFFDTYALIEIIRKNPNYKKYLGEELMTSILNLGEFYYSLLKETSRRTVEIWLRKLAYITISVDLIIIKKAMLFRMANRKKNFSYIDCVGYVLARENELVFLTGDAEFEDMPNVEYVK